tara:strand:- start:8202 stop:8813 length:612 start_codon:yes stop_codon:yes gene_type:complete
MKNKILSLFLITICFGINAQNVDCNGVTNGPAVLDQCGTCQMAYIYNTATHSVEFLNDITGVNVSMPNMLVLPQDAGNPYWNDCGNNYPVDCNGFVYGPALIDSCNICRLAYIYDYISHNVTMINHEDDQTLAATEVIVLPDDPSNPYWNDCNPASINTEIISNRKLINVIDILGKETNNFNHNKLLFYIYNDGSFEKKVIIE